MSFAFSLIQRQIGCRVLGREIGTGLVTLIKKLNPTDLSELSLKLSMYETKETERFNRKGDLASADGVRDRISCINIFLSHAESIPDLCHRITKLFDDTSTGLLTLSTIHKAKGLEWPRVFVLDGWTASKPLQPSPWARQPWEKTQEKNLIYVAITRAKLDLFYIESGKWKEEGPKPVAQENKLHLLALED